jgi:hypothetical protein
MSMGFYSASKRNEYQKIFLVVKAVPALKADNLTAVCESIVWAVRFSTSHNPVASTVCYRVGYILYV